MNKACLIKGGIVLTLDKESRSGLFDIVVKNGKIAAIDFEGRTGVNEFLSENPGGEIIDAAGKIVIPGLFNSRLISSYSFCKMFFKNCNYENIGSYVSLNLIDRYLAETINKERLFELLDHSYKRQLLNGELFVNECSSSLKKFQIDDSFFKTDWITQRFSLTAYDHRVVSDPGVLRDFVCAGFKADEDINSYAISSLKKTLLSGKVKLVLDSHLTSQAYESIRETFGKPYINTLAENSLLNDTTVLVNPCNITDGEINILSDKGSAILLCPSDYSKMSGDLLLAGKLFDSNEKIILGTGHSGIDILSELRIASSISVSHSVSYERLFRMAVTSPAAFFGIGNMTGSVEKNKSADLVILTLKDLRNSGGLPDLDSETICWHIINSLTTKDITEIFMKGDLVFKSAFRESEQYLRQAAKIAELSSLLYSAGKYREYKEKKLRSGRVDKIELGAEQKVQREPEVFVDMTETVEYTGEGEFKILGQKVYEFEERDNNDEEAKRPEVIEVTSTDSGLNFIDDDSENPGKPKLGIKLIDVKRNVEDTGQEESKIGHVKVHEELEDKPVRVKEEVSADDRPVIKKSALRFGFGDGD